MTKPTEPTKPSEPSKFYEDFVEVDTIELLEDFPVDLSDAKGQYVLKIEEYYGEKTFRLAKVEFVRLEYPNYKKMYEDYIKSLKKYEKELQAYKEKCDKYELYLKEQRKKQYLKLKEEFE